MSSFIGYGGAGFAGNRLLTAFVLAWDLRMVRVTLRGIVRAKLAAHGSFQEIHTGKGSIDLPSCSTND